MKPAQPYMLAYLKIIWQFHAHPVHQKVSRFFGPRYIGDDFFGTKTVRHLILRFATAIVPIEGAVLFELFGTKTFRHQLKKTVRHQDISVPLKKSVKLAPHFLSNKRDYLF
jgi:hypothetical protein